MKFANGYEMRAALTAGDPWRPRKARRRMAQLRRIKEREALAGTDSWRKSLGPRRAQRLRKFD